MKQYTTVFIDWNNTLSYSKFWNLWRNPNHPHNSAFEDIQKLFFATPYTMINNWMRGNYTTENVIKLISDKTGHDYQLLLNELILSCKNMELSSPGIPKLIAELRSRGMKVVLATDNMDCFIRWTVPALKLENLFDDILISYELKALKGDKNSHKKSVFFEEYLQKNSIRNRNSILLDDSIGLKEIIESSGIDFLHVSHETDLKNRLYKLLNA